MSSTIFYSVVLLLALTSVINGNPIKAKVASSVASKESIELEPVTDATEEKLEFLKEIGDDDITDIHDDFEEDEEPEKLSNMSSSALGSSDQAFSQLGDVFKKALEFGGSAGKTGLEWGRNAAETTLEAGKNAANEARDWAQRSSNNGGSQNMKIQLITVIFYPIIGYFLLM